VLLTVRRDAVAARRFFTRALRTLKVMPSEVVADAAPVYPGVLAELVPMAWHHVERTALAAPWHVAAASRTRVSALPIPWRRQRVATQQCTSSTASSNWNDVAAPTGTS
jgi:transposase-like protein